VSFLGGREHLSDEQWFAQYGGSAGAAASSLAPEFAGLIAPLEAKTGKPLGEPGRSKAFRAFYESPEGFRRLADDAERRGTQNPIGLLIRMVEAGEHRLPGSGAG
jgi:hypothetical protein